MKKIWPILFVLVLTLVSTWGGAVFAYYYHYKADKIPPGIEISGIRLEGMEESEALKMLEKKYTVPDKLIFKWEEKEFSAPFPASAGYYELEEAVEKASDLSMVSGPDYDLYNLIRFIPHRRTIEVPFQVSSSYIESVMEELENEIERNVKNASLDIVEGIPVVEEENLGLSFDVEENERAVMKHLQEGIFDNIPLKVEVVEPQIKKEDFPDLTQQLGSYETSLANSNNNRRKNIKVASKELNGHIVDKGEVFSFNEIIGQVSAEKGYKKAPIIRNRRYTLGLGGGICQVSTTLYQAALRSGLHIEQRSNHSRPVSYVPLGFDAAISYNSLDLKFENDKDFPIIITAVVEEQLQVSIFGEEEDPHKEIEIVSEELSPIPPPIRENPDPNLPEGEYTVVQEGQQGYRVNLYRLWLKDGEEIKREQVSSDVYQPVNRIINVGVEEDSPDK